MNALSLPAACLCLASGALLGGAFLAMKLARLLLRGGRVFLFISDLLLGPLCAVTAFTVALAIDKGRLRLFQVVLQGLGAWGAVCALDPLISGAAAGLRRLAAGLRRFFHRRLFRPAAAWGKRLLARLWGLARKLLPAKRPKRKGASRRGKQRGKSRRVPASGKGRVPGGRGAPPAAGKGRRARGGKSAGKKVM